VQIGYKVNMQFTRNKCAYHCCLSGKKGCVQSECQRLKVEVGLQRSHSNFKG
jgi:hypothetical protein